MIEPLKRVEHPKKGAPAKAEALTLRKIKASTVY